MYYDCSNYYDQSYYMSLIPRLEEYIDDELNDSNYYKELAKLAPTPWAKDIINQFSIDEADHAERFQEMYMCITGVRYIPKPLNPVMIKDYKEELKIRALPETKDFRKYGEEYLMAYNKHFKDSFFRMSQVEGGHAMLIPILLEEG